MTPQEAQQAAARVMARCDELAAISAEPGKLTRFICLRNIGAPTFWWANGCARAACGCGKTASAISVAVMKG